MTLYVPLELTLLQKLSFNLEGETNIIECAELLREALNENVVEVDDEENEPVQEIIPELPKLKIYSAEPIIDRKSIFQAFYVDITTSAEGGDYFQEIYIW